MWDSLANDSCDHCEYSRKQLIGTKRSSEEEEEDHQFLDKEDCLSLVKDAEEAESSLYDETMRNLPTISCGTDSSPHCALRRSLLDIDTTSQDSGYGTIGFIAENGRYLSYASPTRHQSSTSFHSGLISPLADDFLEAFSEIEPSSSSSSSSAKINQPSSALPNDFSKLVQSSLIGPQHQQQQQQKQQQQQAKEEYDIFSPKSSPKDTIIRPLFRRALSLQQNPSLKSSNNKIRTSLFGSTNNIAVDHDHHDDDGDDDDNDEIVVVKQNNKENRLSTKRCEPPTKIESTMIKRSKLYRQLSATPITSTKPNKHHHALFKRQFSATEESIMCAVQRSSNEPDLIGDFSKNYCLPLINGRHQDLKSITAETLARLMKGEFRDSVESFKVIDCRYPYEFIGGHINGAINIYTKEQIFELLRENHQYNNNDDDDDDESDDNATNNDTTKRQILVFHCEFSSERAPNLYRYLRQEDRTKNMSDYPLLNYPEIYLLEGGYKSFFEFYSDMCIPIAYKAMLHPDHEDDLRHFRQKSKTWNCDSRQRPTKSLKRL